MALNDHTIDLDDCASPDDVVTVLLRAADRFRESATELESAWQDRNAGKPWDKLATILDRAARQCDKALNA